MNKQDGDELITALKDYVATEIKACNTMTKYGGSALLQDISFRINQCIIRDTNKEKLWDEMGEEWLAKQNKETEKKEPKNIIDAKKTISSKLLDEKLKDEVSKKNNK